MVKGKDVFGRIDLAINLSSEVVLNYSAQDIHQFALTHGFSDVTINWVPTMDNVEFVASHIPETRRWLIEFYDLVSETRGMETSYIPVAERLIGSYMGKQMNFQDLCESWATTILHSIQIDLHGNVMAKTEAIGDVPICSRTKGSVMGNVMDGQPIHEMVNEKIPYYVSEAVRVCMRGKCKECDFVYPCINSGVFVYNKMLKGKTNNDDIGDCENGLIYSIMSKTVDRMREMQ